MCRITWIQTLSSLFDHTGTVQRSLRICHGRKHPRQNHHHLWPTPNRGSPFRTSIHKPFYRPAPPQLQHQLLPQQLHQPPPTGITHIDHFPAPLSVNLWPLLPLAPWPHHRHSHQNRLHAVQWHLWCQHLLLIKELVSPF